MNKFKLMSKNLILKIPFILGILVLTFCAGDFEPVDKISKEMMEEMAAMSSSSAYLYSSGEGASSFSVGGISSSNEEVSSSGISEISSSSYGDSVASSSSEEEQSGGSVGLVVLSSSSIEPSQSSSSVVVSSSSATQSSSCSSVASPPSSSSVATSSSSVALTCTGLSSTGYATRQIAQPTLTCGNGETATAISWLGTAINWNSPAVNTYNITARATCGATANLTASCGTLVVSALPTLSCTGMAAKGYAGLQITQPTLSCSSGAISNSAFTGAPAWSSPAKGTYTVGATADCGNATNIVGSCGTLSVVDQPTLICTMPSSVFEGVAMAQPTVTCSDGATPTSKSWDGYVPTWSNPALGNYFVTAKANCGAGVISANCGDLEVKEAKLTCETVPSSGMAGASIATPALTCNNGASASSASWTNAPTWSNPIAGTYTNISVTATCGTATNLSANCSGSLKILGKCGIRTEAFDVDLYECGTGTQSNWIYLKGGITDNRDGKEYKAVLIGTQTWMAENLNYAEIGSKCGNYGSWHTDENTVICDTYGRLYNWAVAMGLPTTNPNCNSSFCSDQVQSNHRGICPEGWHIPSFAEWETLNVQSQGVTRLKATGGWNKDTGYKPGTDDFGFSAMPGGSGSVGGSLNFNNLGSSGNWWSSTEIDNYSNLARDRVMRYNEEHFLGGNAAKERLYSVRCLLDN